MLVCQFRHVPGFFSEHLCSTVGVATKLYRKVFESGDMSAVFPSASAYLLSIPMEERKPLNKELLKAIYDQTFQKLVEDIDG